MAEKIKFARTLRKNMTDSEIKFWTQFLRKYPIRVRRQHPVDKYVLDFYCMKAKLGIELDGGQHFSPEGIRKDEERTKLMEEKYGIKIIRFSDNEVMTNFYNVCNKTDEEIRKRLDYEIPPYRFFAE